MRAENERRAGNVAPEFMEAIPVVDEVPGNEDHLNAVVDDGNGNEDMENDDDEFAFDFD